MEKTQEVKVNDVVLFDTWIVYHGEEMPDIQTSDYVGDVIEVWGLCRTFLRVRRRHDGKRVIMFPENIIKVLQSRSSGPKNAFAAAALGFIDPKEKVKK